MTPRSANISRAVAAAVLIAAVLTVLALAGLWVSGRVLPAWTNWQEVSKLLDLDDNGRPEQVRVSARRLVIEDEGRSIAAPADWIVSDCKCADLTGDGRAELVVLAWRRGSFGTSRPFWERGPDRNFTQHVFVLSYHDARIEPLWMSSDVGARIASMRIVGNAYIGLTSTDGEESIWEWDSWGLVRVENELLSIAAVGDNLIHDSLYESMRSDDESGFDFNPLYEDVAPYIAGFDLAAVQQETILTTDANALSSYPRFATPAALADALAEAGFDIVCSASNHAFDAGEAGVLETCAIWKERHPDLTVLGIHDSAEDAARISYLEHKGIRVALFDYSYGLNGERLPTGKDYLIDTIEDRTRIAADLGAAQDADARICFVHMGDEFSRSPSDEQEAFISFLIDSGADCIICTHAHIAQSSEVIQTPAGKSGLVYWCLGNFASHMTERSTILGQAAQIVVRKRADGTCWISDWGAKPLVCHFDKTGTRVKLLEDYSDALAQEHRISSPAEPLSCSELWQRWHTIRPQRAA